MTISKTALEAFVNRDLDNWDWIKKATKEEIDEAISDLGVNVRLKNELYLHQKTTFYLGALHEGFMFFLDMGTGKSLIALSLLIYRQKLRQIESGLIIVPNVVHLEGWREEIEKQTNLNYRIVEGSSSQRIAMFEEPDVDVYVINYDGLQAILSTLEKVKNSKKRKRTANQTLIKNITSRIQMVIFDEIYEAKNSESLVYRLCNHISKRCDYRIGMTGTPFGRNPEDLWAQFHLVDRGDTLGPSLGFFRNVFFKDSKNQWGGTDYIFEKSKSRLLHRTLKHRSLRYADTECHDLPKQIEIPIPLRLSKDSLEYYNRLLEEANNTLDIDIRRQKNYYAKWRQIASGFVYLKDEEENERIALRFSHTEKTDALEIILEEIPSKSKLIVFHLFDESGRIIAEKLEELKIPFASINSLAEEYESSLKLEYQKFKTDPKCRVAVVNISSGHAGLNLQVANYTVYWEPIDRPIWQSQSLKRTHRDGQKKRCYYYHFYTPHTVEERVRGFLIEGKNLFEELMEGRTAVKDLHQGFTKLLK